MICLLALALTGCKTIADIKPDTIVEIPLDPTAAETEAVTEIPTAAQTEPTETTPLPTETQPPTEAETTKPNSATSGGKTSGGKTGGGKTSGGKGNTGSKPPATQPPTEAPTQPPTEPPTEAPTVPLSYDPAGYCPGDLDRAVADAVNIHRQEAGLEPLPLDPQLCAIASVRAWELSLEWSHRRPDGSDGLTVLSQYGYPHSWAAENLFNGAAGGERIAARWMQSESTAANILSESAAVIGVGSYTSPDGLTCVAAIFVQ